MSAEVDLGGGGISFRFSPCFGGGGGGGGLFGALFVPGLRELLFGGVVVVVGL